MGIGKLIYLLGCMQQAGDRVLSLYIIGKGKQANLYSCSNTQFLWEASIVVQELGSTKLTCMLRWALTH